VTSGLQHVSQLNPQHLIEIKPHNSSRRVERRKFGMQNCLARVIQRSLNILPD
jgi:hypothetical protein